MPSYVLVVDDEEPICTLLRRQLEGWGYAVEIALNATEGLERMLVDPASIAIVDLKMPGRDGLWLAEQIHKRWPRTAIIIATGAHEFGSIEESRTLGVVDWVLKPFDREQLRHIITRAAAGAHD
jgi:DNA-binding NtrC family response regulator